MLRSSRLIAVNTLAAVGFVVGSFFAVGPAFAQKVANEKVVFEVTAKHKDQACVGCHIQVTPGIVKDHMAGKMASPTNAKDYVGCNDCHGEEHTKNEDYKQAKMPTAQTCKKCHLDQVGQYKAGKHNLAWFAQTSQQAWHGQPASIVKQGYRGCSGCHKLGEKGWKGKLSGFDKMTHDGGKEESEYRYGNAQCDACHTRHAFSKKEAQNPRACSNCHMGFDHPQWEMFVSSKHGVIWESDPTGTRAPTCQTCHMNGGNHEVRTPWGFLGLRLPTKDNVLALIKVAPSLKDNLTKLAAGLPSGNYVDVDDDPQWTFDRAMILQAAGLLDGNLQLTARAVEVALQAQAARGPEQFNAERNKMKQICNNCHAKDFVKSFFMAGDDIVKQVDNRFAKAIQAVQGLYKDGILKKPAGWEYGPDLLQYYDAKTGIELELFWITLEYKQRAFQGAFHASNDYMHWYGWSPLNRAVNQILEEEKRMRKEHAMGQKLGIH